MTDDKTTDDETPESLRCPKCGATDATENDEEARRYRKPRATCQACGHTWVLDAPEPPAASMEPDDEYEDCPACAGEAVPPDVIAAHEEACAYVSHDVLDDGGGRCNTCRTIMPACPACGPHHGRKYIRPEPPAASTEPAPAEHCIRGIDYLAAELARRDREGEGLDPSERMALFQLLDEQQGLIVMLDGCGARLQIRGFALGKLRPVWRPEVAKSAVLEVET